MSVRAKTCRRPNRSARRPPTLAPTAIPTNPIEAIQAVSLGSSAHCAASAAMTNEISPTSIASRAQPMPEPVSTRRCARVKGRRSRRSESVDGRGLRHPSCRHATDAGPARALRQQFADERLHLRAEQLDRAQHLVVRQGARRELHVEPVEAERPRRCRRSCGRRSRASRRTARRQDRRRAGSAGGCRRASRARGRSSCSWTRSPRTPRPTPADRSRRCGRASGPRSAARHAEGVERAVIQVDEQAEAMPPGRR